MNRNETRIISNLRPEHREAGADRSMQRPHPIATYLNVYLSRELATCFCTEARLEEATVEVDFTVREWRDEVETMRLAFRVRSGGRDALEDVFLLYVFERVARQVFGSERILLSHRPADGFGAAEYVVDDLYAKLALLETLRRVGCDVQAAFTVVPEGDAVWEDAGKALVGRFGYGLETCLEMYVRTDDERSQPHVHVRDLDVPGRDLPIALTEAAYCPHGGILPARLAGYELEYLVAFMAKPCRSPRFVNNYEYAVAMWNANNDAPCPCPTDGDGNIVIPDYSQLPQP